MAMMTNTKQQILCLNPCFGGIWSLRQERVMTLEELSLNPCFGGIWSLRANFISFYFITCCILKNRFFVFFSDKKCTFSYCKDTDFFPIIQLCQRTFSSFERLSKEQGCPRLGDNIDVDFLTDDLHGLKVVGRDGHNEDAVLVIVACLHLGKVVFYLFEHR